MRYYVNRDRILRINHLRFNILCAKYKQISVTLHIGNSTEPGLKKKKACWLRNTWNMIDTLVYTGLFSMNSLLIMAHSPQRNPPPPTAIQWLMVPCRHCNVQMINRRGRKALHLCHIPTVPDNNNITTLASQSDYRSWVMVSDKAVWEKWQWEYFITKPSLMGRSTD